MSISHRRPFQFFKYAVYTLLAFNIYIFWAEEHLAASVQFSNGVALLNLIDAYAATIDTAAWVVLLLMFELETYALDDHHFSPLVARALQSVRAVSYAFITYAFYGYIVNLDFVSQASQLAGIRDLCALVIDRWSYAIDLDEYTLITAANCSTFSAPGTFFQLPAINAVVDAKGLTDIQRLAWVDVINAAVWLLIVVILEVDVWLQERNRFDGKALAISNAVKVVLYSLLLIAAVYWGFKGDFVDFWDAFLWMVAFVFIELNVFEWRQEVSEQSPVSGR